MPDEEIKWPGEAAVVVSFVHIAKGIHKGLKKLDGREVETIYSISCSIMEITIIQKDLLANAEKVLSGQYHPRAWALHLTIRIVRE